MARFARIDSQIRTNRLIVANPFRVPELTPFLRIALWGTERIANRRFEAIRANPSNVLKIEVFLRIDPRSNKRCFLNGVFQIAVVRAWSGSARADGTKML